MIIKTPVHVMIVDDERDFVEMLAVKLKDAGFEVTPAYDGQECLDRLQANNIDVVVLDIKMPGLDGIEVLREIKRLYPILEVILLTGHGSIETSVRGMKLGAFDYLLKPADFDELLEKLHNARQRKEAHEERIRKAEAQLLLRESRRGGRLPFEKD
ncbi:MAG: response regulator [Desulfobacterales bacterium]